MQSHRADLEKLSEKDPDFFEFLKEQDADLLEFNESDYEVEVDDEDNVHQPIDVDEEPPEKVKIGKHSISVRVDHEDRKIANQKLADALEEMLSDPNQKRAVLREAVNLAIQLFQTCAVSVGAKIENLDYVVNSSEVIDSIVGTCLKHMSRCLLFLMNPVASKSKTPSTVKSTSVTFKFWKKYRNTAKVYLHALIKFMIEINEKEALMESLRSILDLAELIVHFPKVSRVLTKLLIKVWSRKSIEEREVAFSALKRLCEHDPKHFAHVYKKCYVAYISVSKVVSTNAWKNLLYMQDSFGELTYLNPESAYQYAFAYIRQFAIHLRNAKIAKRKDVIKTVYNWQYILGLYLWASVLIQGRNQDENPETEAVASIQELLHSVIQITIGLIDVFNAPRYIPIRLHCIRVLLQLQINCEVYIPTLSLTSGVIIFSLFFKQIFSV